MTDQLGTPREGVMSTAASLSSVMKPRFIEPVGERTKLKKVMLASFVTLGQWRQVYCWCVFTQQQRENLHTTQTSTLLPTYDEVVNLTGCCKQRIERIDWKKDNSMQVKVRVIVKR
jgi:hypothetical protein